MKRDTEGPVGFTPGPWRVSGWCEGRPFNRTLPAVAAGPATVAIMHVAPITPMPEAEANARLIAEAPAMLEALIEARCALEVAVALLAGGPADWPNSSPRVGLAIAGAVLERLGGRPNAALPTKAKKKRARRGIPSEPGPAT